MNEQQEYELEIDIIEWLREIKSHIAVIIGITLLFAAGAGLYVYKMTEPVFSYTLFINCPNSLQERDKLTFANAMKNDIGAVKVKDKIQKAALSNVELVKDGKENNVKDRYTNLMKFEFQGNSPDYVKTYGAQYVKAALQQINKYIDEQYEINFSKEYLETVRKEIQGLNNRITSGTVYQNESDPAKIAVDYLQLLKERLETKELSKSVAKAEIMDSQSNSPRTIKNNSLIWKSAALGFFLSFAFVSCKYFAKAVSRK